MHLATRSNVLTLDYCCSSGSLLLPFFPTKMSLHSTICLSGMWCCTCRNDGWLPTVLHSAVQGEWCWAPGECLATLTGSIREKLLEFCYAGPFSGHLWSPWQTLAKWTPIHRNYAEWLHAQWRRWGFVYSQGNVGCSFLGTDSEIAVLALIFFGSLIPGLISCLLNLILHHHIIKCFIEMFFFPP